MARNPLSLHQLNALDASPAELVAFAGRLGVANVCLFTRSLSPLFPTVNAGNEAEVTAALKATGVRVYNVEYVGVTPDMSFDGVAEAFALSRRIGAERMTVHVHDTEEARALENFARVCRLAADEGLSIGVEWTAINLAMNTLAKTKRFVDLADQPNAALCVDLIHLTRSGGTPAEVAALPAGSIGYAQISDGPLDRSLDAYRTTEFISERLPPGDGEFPTADFVAAIPPGVVIEVEAPQAAAKAAGVSAFDRCRIAIEAARRFVA